MASNQLVSLSRSHDGKIAVLALNNAPVNALTRSLCDELRMVVQRLEAEDTCQALVLTSAISNVFCAGLDLKQMVQPRLHEFVPFWSSFLRCFVALFNSRLVTVAGINGHAIAGGTVLALACDYRVMLRSSKSGGAGKVFQVGLSEVSIGLPVPDWICSVLERVVGTRSAERMTTTGKLFSADAAVGEGLVDKAVDLSDEVVLASFHLLEIHLKAPSHHSRSLVKSYFRKPLSHSLLGNLDEISTSMFDTLKLPPIQTAVQANAKPSKKRSRL